MWLSRPILSHPRFHLELADVSKSIDNRDARGNSLLPQLHLRCYLPKIGVKKVYTKGVFSSENSSASTGKIEAWCIPKTLFRDRKGTPKNFCDKDFAELSGELSGAICLKTLVLMGNDR